MTQTMYVCVITITNFKRTFTLKSFQNYLFNSNLFAFHSVFLLPVALVQLFTTSVSYHRQNNRAGVEPGSLISAG